MGHKMRREGVVSIITTRKIEVGGLGVGKGRPREKIMQTKVTS